MRCIKLNILLTACVLLLGSCREVESFRDDVYGNFDALWKIIDEHYCYLDEKGLDWQQIGQDYRAQLSPDMEPTEYFPIFGEMVNELKDGHVNLSASFNTTYYRKWWADYPQNFNLRCLEEHYLGFNWDMTAGCMYKHIGEDVGYVRYASFSNTVNDTGLDYILYSLRDCKALILDIRDNSGGNLTNVETLVSRFIDKEITAGYIIHKTGPGHDDFSEPYEFRYKPNEDHVRWLRPVILLVNRTCFSAANNFVGIMRTLPNVLTVGSRTGGGGGLPFSDELPNGWLIRFSACPILDPNGESVENGVDPSPNCFVDCTPEEFAAGKDNILDFALDIAGQIPPLVTEEDQ